MKDPILMPDGMTNLVDAAREYATFAHAGQTRRDNKTPYIEHPRKVVELLAGEGDPDARGFDTDPQIIAAAWLHDVIEDSRRTAKDMLEAGFPQEVVQAVAWLTKGDNHLPYESYLAGVKNNPIARRVKIADILANLTDSPTPRKVERYAKGILFLAS